MVSRRRRLQSTCISIQPGARPLHCWTAWRCPEKLILAAPPVDSRAKLWHCCPGSLPMRSNFRLPQSSSRAAMRRGAKCLKSAGQRTRGRRRSPQPSQTTRPAARVICPRRSSCNLSRASSCHGSSTPPRSTARSRPDRRCTSATLPTSMPTAASQDFGQRRACNRPDAACRRPGGGPFQGQRQQQLETGRTRLWLHRTGACRQRRPRVVRSRWRRARSPPRRDNARQSLWARSGGQKRACGSKKPISSSVSRVMDADVAGDRQSFVARRQRPAPLAAGDRGA